MFARIVFHKAGVGKPLWRSLSCLFLFPKTVAKREPLTYFDKTRVARPVEQSNVCRAVCREPSFSSSQGAVFDKPLRPGSQGSLQKRPGGRFNRATKVFFDHWISLTFRRVPARKPALDAPKFRR